MQEKNPMNKLLLFCTMLILSGCTTTVPVKQKFPDAPQILLQDCEKLTTIEKDQVLFSDFLKTVVENYTKYHECHAQNAAWVEWYKKQKEVFDK